VLAVTLAERLTPAGNDGTLRASSGNGGSTMKIKRGWLLGATAILALVGATGARSNTGESPGTVAPAHSTGKDIRKPADCAQLGGDAGSGEQAACNKCLAIGKTHFHPDCPAGKRCNLDNGKQDCEQQPPGWDKKGGGGGGGKGGDAGASP
jgi:hypothetical protein